METKDQQRYLAFPRLLQICELSKKQASPTIRQVQTSFWSLAALEKSLTRPQTQTHVTKKSKSDRKP